jgi:Xaa-Pro dipeptidase
MSAVNLDWHAERAGLLALRLLDREPPADEIDLEAVRRDRLERVRAQMAERDIAACLLFDPVNIRYATGARNMQVYHLRNPSRYLLLPVEGPVLLFEFAGCMHLADDLETIDEVRPALTASFVAAGPGIAERERRWASETAAVIRQLCGFGVRLGIERVNAGQPRRSPRRASHWSTRSSRSSWRGRSSRPRS